MYRPILNIPITTKEKRLDRAALFFMIATVLLFLWSYLTLPDIVPIHWNFKGEADDYGSKNWLALMPFLALIYHFGLVKLCDYPHRFNYVQKLTEDNVKQEYKKGRRIIRIVNVFSQIVFLMLFFFSARAAVTSKHDIGNWFLILVGGFTVWLMYYAFSKPKIQE